MLPEDEFRLIGIVARFPDGFAKQMTLEERQPGVYDINVGPLPIRLLVIRNLPDRPANAMLKLFSIVPAQIEFACRHYHPLSPYTTGIVDDLIRMYRKEDKRMASTIEELNRKIIREALESATVDDRLRGLTVKDRLKGLSAEEVEEALRELKRKKTRKK
jgi:hypothetical protein